MAAGPDFTVTPGGTLAGRVRVPGDKSISHRAVLLGALAVGETEISGYLEGADTLATVAAVRALGVEVAPVLDGSTRVTGRGLGGLSAPAGPLDLGNAGTAMRLLAGVLAGQRFDTVLGGDASLSRRPMGRIIEPLAAMGARIESRPGGLAPLTVRGGRVLRGIDYEMPVASAQVKSCLLLAGLHATGHTRVVEPAPTRDHTERMLAGFGYPVEREGDRVGVAGGGVLRARPVAVPGDLSSAAFLVVGAILSGGPGLVVEGVGVNPTRTGFLDVLERMGARIEIRNRRDVAGEPVADLHIGPARLRGIEVPPELVPLAIDEFPVLAVAAACAEGETVVTGAAELRVKESDRIAVMVEGLGRLGVEAAATHDGLVVRGGRLAGGTVASHGDHRVAMAFAVAGLAATGPVRIADCANVDTSYPGFVASTRSLGLPIEVAPGRG